MNPASHPLCELVDRSIEYVTEEGFLPHRPGSLFATEELVNHLRAAAARQPHIMHVNLRDSLRVVIAIGGPLAAIRVIRLWLGTSWTAVADRPYTTEIHGFFSAGYCPDIPPEHLMPADDVIGMAVHLVVHGELSDTHLWLDDQGIPCRRIDYAAPAHEHKSPDSGIPF